MELSNKKKIACVGLLAMSAAFAAVTLSIFQGFGDALVDASQTEYVLEFSNSKNKPTEGDVSSGSYNAETELGNLIRFEIGRGEFSESGFLTLDVGGTFGNPYDAEEENRNRISGILGITVTGDFQEGDLVLYTGFDADLGVSESNSYPLKSGTEANPDFGYSFFQIKNDGTSACSIDSVSVRYSCVVQDASVADLVYEINSERTGYEITDYTGTGGEVVIPSEHKGLPVTSIGYRAFYNCTSLTSVTFAEGSQLESIGDDAFYRCSSLEDIVYLHRLRCLLPLLLPRRHRHPILRYLRRPMGLLPLHLPDHLLRGGIQTFRMASALELRRQARRLGVQRTKRHYRRRVRLWNL